MKGFLLKSFAFITPLIIIVLLLELNLKKVINEYSYKKNCFESQIDSIQILILGSSQAAYGVDPLFFSKKTFNMAMPSQSLYYDIHITEKYLDRMPSLEYVIITLSYFSFEYEVIESIEKWRDYYYAHFYGIRYPEISPIDIRNYSKIGLYSPDTSLTYLMKGFNVNLASGFSSGGYFRRDTSNLYFRINDSSGLQRIKFHESLMRKKYIERNLSDLKNFIYVLGEKNIDVILVTPPVFSTYSKCANPTIVKDNLKIIKEICDQFKCQYIDYFADERFNKKDFYDNDHLNFIGAEKFSRLINGEILN